MQEVRPRPGEAGAVDRVARPPRAPPSQGSNAPLGGSVAASQPQAWGYSNEHDRSQGSRHRRLQGRPGDRDLREARRHRRREDSLVTLESDKATMDVPSPVAGKVKDVHVKIGDKVAEGSLIVVLEPRAAAVPSRAARAPAAAAVPAAPPSPAPPHLPPQLRAKVGAPTAASAGRSGGAPDRHTAAPADRGEGSRAAHASPSLRKFARELGVDLARVTGTSPKGRILQEDVQSFVKQVMSGAVAGAGGAAASAAAARSISCRGRASTSRSSARPNRGRCRGSRRSRARTSRATG